MKKFLLLLTLFLSVNYYGQFVIKKTAIDTIPTALDAGQSNCEGGSLTTPYSSLQYYQPNTLIFFKPNDASATNNGSWQNLNYTSNNMWRSNVGRAVFGDELSLGYHNYQNTGRKIALIKYGYAGSGLVDDGSTVVATGLWEPDANLTRCNNLQHYNNFVNNFIIPAIMKARAANIFLNIKALIWMQGEYDANYSYTSTNYETKLIAMINRLKSDLAGYPELNPNFTVIINRIHNNESPALPYVNTVRTALVNTATYFNGYWTDTDAYGLNADLLHYNGNGQEQRGIDNLAKFILIPN